LNIFRVRHFHAARKLNTLAVVNPAVKHKVLITGSAGRIGKAATQEIVRRGHRVRGLDKIPSTAATESLVGDITDAATINSAVAGVDAIIHLAATPDDDDFMTKLLPNNIVPVHHILEAARLNKVPRVILASSGQVTWESQFNGPFPVRADAPLTPRYWYAVTKVFSEFAGQIYATKHQMDVMAIRLGACPRDRAAVESTGNDPITRDVYLSPGDAGRFFAQAVEAPAGFAFQVVYVCSKFVLREIFDLEPARRLVGFEPRDRWPEGLPSEIVGDQPIPGTP
jgi:nucleoside-diphosphate-sugar epimerase